MTFGVEAARGAPLAWGGIMVSRGGARSSGAAIILSAAAAAAAAATQTELPVLGRLEPGLWQLRSLEGGGAMGAVCLGDRGLLAQLRHRAQVCPRSVVASGQDMVEIRYSCPAAVGQTTIRTETSRLARVETQGIDNGVPFAFRVEARRIGPCR
jgi:hypothetical protein